MSDSRSWAQTFVRSHTATAIGVVLTFACIYAITFSAEWYSFFHGRLGGSCAALPQKPDTGDGTLWAQPSRSQLGLKASDGDAYAAAAAPASVPPALPERSVDWQLEDGESIARCLGTNSGSRACHFNNLFYDRQENVYIMFRAHPDSDLPVRVLPVADDDER